MNTKRLCGLAFGAAIALGSFPYGAQFANINGVQYYVLGATYYRPCFGNNGVYYQVVPNPI